MAVKMEGPLSKWTNVVKGWQYRWFLLDENTGLLSYYTSKDKMMRGARRGCLRLRGAQIGIDDEDDSTFTISSDQKTFHFQARDSKEREDWIKALEETINSHTQNDKTNAFSIPTEEELNHRMAEAEAYFRILTQQVKNLEIQISASNSERCQILKDSMTKMIESIGQTLELLHVTKTTMLKKMPVPIISGVKTVPDPVQTVSTQVNQNSIEKDNEADKEESKPNMETSESETVCPVEAAVEQIENLRIENDSKLEIGYDVIATDDDKTTTTTSESATTTASEPTTTTDAQAVSITVTEAVDSNEVSDSKPEIGDVKSETGVIAALRAVETMPCTSYSSSDDDDDDDDAEFFDANEYSEISVEEVKQPLSNGELADKRDQSAEKLQEEKIRTISYCEEDDDHSEDMGGSVEQHGSVITHLLSQVKIGMDLTKVTLPTFILERRSLLEMYADFFAHPDLFKGIPDLEHPKDRMIQVLKWYLSSFHAGRKGSVAKKPYNPILGEIFQCNYDLTEEKTRNMDDFVTDGPVNGATKEDVTFIAEQVSHHPPISAFYAECYNKRVCFESSLWTKSKFLGLSIGVHMVGQGMTYVLDHDETYVMTFPNGYGRSILTVPWVELGGKTEITCSKTGYVANIEFHTKPFYGGKRHRITADVFAPGEKKPFLSVNGEWNGVMYAVYPGQKEPEVFFDTHVVPVVKKKVMSLAKQQSFESRRLWQEVTRNLKSGNIEKASEAKHKLEEKQRADARDRKENGTKWKNRVFTEEENGVWSFNEPLWKRFPTS